MMRIRTTKPAHYLIAKTYEDKKQYDLAATFYKKAIGKAGSKKPDLYYRYGRVLYKLERYNEAVEQLEIAIGKSSKTNDEYLLRYAEALIKSKRYVDAEKRLLQAIEVNGNRASLHYVLGVVLCIQKKWWQAEDSLLAAKELGYKTAKFYRRLGQASFAMEHYDIAYDAYRNAAELWSENVSTPITKSELYYRAGLSSELNGDKKSIYSELYQEASELDGSLGSKRFGIGVFHEKHSLYDKALESYKKDSKSKAYKKRDILFKYGKLLYKMESYSEALRVTIECTKYDYVDAEKHALLADIYRNLGEHRLAAESYKNALDRHSDINQNLINRYLHSLSKLGETDRIEEVLGFINMISLANGADSLGSDNPPSVIKSYAAMYEKVAIEEKTILYESFHGKAVSDNPAAILEGIISRDNFREYKNIIVINNVDDIPEHLRSYENIIPVSRGSILYAYYLVSSEYLINNTTFPGWFIRRDSQKYLNTWHGVPWKHLGKDITTTFLTEMSNVQRNFLQATHLINPNEYTSNVLLDRYDVRDIITAKNAELGYPRIDITVNMSKARRKEIELELGVDTKKPTVFYAPTWRGATGEGVNLDSHISDDLERLRELDINVVYRGHHLSGSDGEGIIQRLSAPGHISTNELLAVTDVLITDYSSVAFDFMATGKPIVFYLHDYEEYKSDRGLYFEYDELPCAKVFTRSEMISTVKDTLDNTSRVLDSRYKRAITKFCPYEDGNATARTIDFLFKGDESHVVASDNSKRNIFMYAGPFMSNGITTSAINLMNTIDQSRYNIYLLVDPWALSSHADRLKNFSNLPSGVRVIARTSDIVATKGELDTFRERMYCLIELSAAQAERYRNVFHREAKRLVGVDTVFDVVINYEGYSRYHAHAVAAIEAQRSAIYLHNDMYSEYSDKYKYLKLIFDAFKDYDKLVSVSRATNDLNRKSLATLSDVDSDKFVYVENAQTPDRVVAMAEEDIDSGDSYIFSENKTVFIAIGRLSVEKDHEKLIYAFKNVHEQNPKTKLVILGDGPLRYRLESLVGELSLDSHVHLLGLRSNPYPYLRASDCFVLSSNYEGQPVVLFEALALKKPIIATDIVANRAVLEGGYGELCNNSTSGLESAMGDFVEGKLKFDEFDVYAYNDRAMEMLYEKVLR